jgi:hypothetical protein
MLQNDLLVHALRERAHHVSKMKILWMVKSTYHMLQINLLRHGLKERAHHVNKIKIIWMVK